MSKLQFIEEGRLNNDEMNSINGGDNCPSKGNTYYCSTDDIKKVAHYVVANCSYNYHYCDNEFAVINPGGTTIAACSGNGQKIYREPAK